MALFDRIIWRCIVLSIRLCNPPTCSDAYGCSLGPALVFEEGNLMRPECAKQFDHLQASRAMLSRWLRLPAAPPDMPNSPTPTACWWVELLAAETGLPVGIKIRRRRPEFLGVTHHPHD